ncbi:hypothetical protein HZH66_007833 [Vespula vulgaris]|uniref:Uncharacterized protein n=1 Tax=Vespula vulgaris TaxID=7454 RepID=A0A834JU32_VESVU|nr:hypothetical protein HZH66_007833 [Vespula vulgaris]
MKDDFILTEFGKVHIGKGRVTISPLLVLVLSLTSSSSSSSSSSSNIVIAIVNSSGSSSGSSKSRGQLGNLCLRVSCTTSLVNESTINQMLPASFRVRENDWHHHLPLQ